VPDRIERPLQMFDRLLVGGAPQCLGGRTLMVRDGTHRPVGAVEMLGQLRRDRLKAARPRRFESSADACG
jgi:hypothetical protein